MRVLYTTETVNEAMEKLKHTTWGERNRDADRENKEKEEESSRNFEEKKQKKTKRSMNRRQVWVNVAKW
jgi:hypothetical protein